LQRKALEMLNRPSKTITESSATSLTLPEIIMADDLVELRCFDTEEGRQLIVEMVAPQDSRNASQLAAYTGAFEVFKWLDEKQLFNVHATTDSDGNTLFMLAATGGHLHIIEYLLNRYPEDAYDFLELPNNLGQTAAEISEECAHYAITNFLRKRALIEQMRVANREFAEVIPEVEMDLSTFIYGDALTTKGLLLMLHYHASKAQEKPKPYLAMNDKELLQVLHLFIESKESEVLLLLSADSHRCACRLEKHAGKAYLIIVDSTPATRTTHAKGLAEQIKILLPELHNKIVLCVNETNQQTDRKHCSYFAAKNLRKLALMKNMVSMVSGSHFVSTKKQYGVDIVTYRLPTTFMSLAQSPDGLAKYINDNSAEADVILRTNKRGVQQKLRSYAEQSRAGFGVVTPAIIQDKHDSTKKIPQNNSIIYFKEKYNQRVVPTLFNSFGRILRQEKLQEIVSNHNAAYLLVDEATGKLISGRSKLA
jgi:uncharacterized protein YgbK (DUF1537 family)